MAFTIRPATLNDVKALQELIDLSIRKLSVTFYTQAQIDGSLGYIFGPDTQLIADSTYFLATPANDPDQIVACGGWSFRKTLFGTDIGPNRMPVRRDPATEPASIRAIFVHPDWSRRGLGTLIMLHCEKQAQDAGFTKLEMGSTQMGKALYSRCGYHTKWEDDVELPNGERLRVIHMEKTIESPEDTGQCL